MTKAVEKSASLTRREILLGGAAGAAALCVSTSGADLTEARIIQKRDTAPGWVATWAQATVPSSREFPIAGDGFSNQTLRQMLPTTAGGSAVRLRISNVWGTAGLRIGKASIGLARTWKSAALIADGVRPVTFGGAASVIVSPGQEIVSDVISFALLPGQVVGVDLYLPESTGYPESSTASLPAVYVAAGDHSGEDAGNAFAAPVGGFGFAPASGSYLVGLDVRNPESSGCIVVAGDSSNINPWPKYLWRRLRTELGNRAPSVVEATNSIQKLASSAKTAPSLVSRFEADVLSMSGVKTVIVNAGLVDLLWPTLSKLPATALVPPHDITAEQIIDAYNQLISRAHARGVQILGCTLMPCKGFEWLGSTYPGDQIKYSSPVEMWSDQVENVRQVINRWIHTSGAFDGIVDFAAVSENPLDTSVRHPRYTDDGAHVNNYGALELAFAVNLSLLSTKSVRSSGASKKESGI